ncbi:MAG: gliding motility-associated protein GldE [Bacteroidales bacterium]|nr:gliding motility-associated protein GldE [Bacteroidales bacterium]MDD3892042.1 gliding motility-associated protein GldE [Bacteroidales bacterium]
MNSILFTVLSVLALPKIELYPITIGVVVGLVILVLLLALSSLISGSESSFFSLTPTHIKSLKEDESRASKMVLELLQKPERLLASILIANNFINVAIIILSTFLTNSIIDFSNSPIFGFISQVVVITFIILLFGEIAPKILATSKPKSFSRAMALPMYALYKIFYPLNHMLVSSTAQVSRRFNPRRNISIDEIGDALDITSGHHPEEKKILRGIVTFGHIEVQEILKPRLDVVAVEISSGFNKLKSVVIESGYSRIPVYEESFDEIRGVLYVKDLIPHIDESDLFEWQKLLREAYFVPETKKINELLSEFQLNRIHLAIVVDEYGGTCGIVSLEDILEEIVGEISDESDEEVSLYTRIDDQNYFFEGKILINDFCKVLDLDDSIFEKVRGEAETLAGVILEITGHLPSKNDVINHKYFRFTIDSVDNKRIKRLKVKVLNDMH